MVAGIFVHNLYKYLLSEAGMFVHNLYEYLLSDAGIFVHNVHEYFLSRQEYLFMMFIIFLVKSGNICSQCL